MCDASLSNYIYKYIKTEESDRVAKNIGCVIIVIIIFFFTKTVNFDHVFYIHIYTLHKTHILCYMIYNHTVLYSGI